MENIEKFMILDVWKQTDFLCKGHILCALEYDLYNVYSEMKISKNLWDALVMTAEHPLVVTGLLPVEEDVDKPLTFVIACIIE